MKLFFLKKSSLLQKEASLYDKRTLEQSRRTDGSSIPPNKKLSLVHFTYMKKKVFFKKSNFNKASDSRMLYLYEIGPECIILVILFLKDGSLSKIIY